MADVTFGGTLRYLIMLRMLESDPVFTSNVERLSVRAAWQRADASNAAIVEPRGLA